MLISYAGSVVAIDYSMDTNFNLRQIFNTNLTIQPDLSNPGDVFGTDLDLNSSFNATSDHWKTQGQLRLDNWFYYGPGANQQNTKGSGGSLNYQNQFVDLIHSYFMERTIWKFAGNYTNASYVSALSGVGTPNQPVGIILGVVSREVGSISPSIQYSLTEKTSLGFGYTYSISNYTVTQKNQGAYPNSESHYLFSNINHYYNEYLSIDGNLSYNTFSTSSRSIDYVTGMAGFKYNYSPDIHASLEGGYQYSHTQNTALKGFAQQTDDQFSPVFTVSLSKDFDLTHLSLNFHRSVMPSINATLFTTDSVSLGANRRLNDKLSANFSASYSQSTYPAQTATGNVQVYRSDNSQKYYQVSSQFTYILTEQVNLVFSYNYVRRDLSYSLSSSSNAADSHGLSLDLRYDFDPFHF